MSKGERPAFPAKYEPGRNPNGQFAPGHQIGAKGRGFEVNKKLNQIREYWYQVNSTEDLERVKTELLRLINDCPNWDVKLKAIVYYMDRMLGKPVESVDMNVTGERGPLVNIDLSPDEMEWARRLIRKVNGSGEALPSETSDGGAAAELVDLGGKPEVIEIPAEPPERQAE